MCLLYRQSMKVLRQSDLSRADVETEQLIRNAMGQAWIAYHLAAGLAHRALERGNPRTYCVNLLFKMSNDIHHFVLQSCKTCHSHHREYCQRFPIKKCTDFERWVFDLHNAVNERVQKPTETDFEKVREHYRQQIVSLGDDANIMTISRAMPAIFGRYCYNC